MPILSRTDANAIATLHFQAGQGVQRLRVLQKRLVSRLSYNGVSYIVKSYRPHWWQRLLGIRPGNLDGVRLLTGFTAPCLADFIADNGNQVTIYPDAGKLDLFDRGALLEMPDSALHDAFREAGALLARLHRSGFFHADTKPPNFVLNTAISALPSVIIIDCDKVRAYSAVPRQRQLFNLAQFIACSRPMDSLERLVACLLEFLKAYQETAMLDDAEFADRLVCVRALVAFHPRIEKQYPPELLDALEKAFQGGHFKTRF